MSASENCGLSRLELDLMLTELRKSRSSLLNQMVREAPAVPTDKLAVQAAELDSIITTLESDVERVEDPPPVSLPFSAADDQTLKGFNIARQGMFYLRPRATLREVIKTSRTVGSDELWSNDNLYKDLSDLLNSVIDIDKIPSRMVIDTFFKRSAVMVPSPQKLMLVLNNHVSAVHPPGPVSQTETFSGTIDYTAIVVNSSRADFYREIPPIMTQRDGRRHMVVFLASVPKPTDVPVPLEDHLPRVVLELVTCARHLGKSHIRGALTTGFQWRFVAVDLDTDGKGAKYWFSQLIEWRWDVDEENMTRECFIEESSDRFDPALIASILSSWIPASFEEFEGSDQWFCLRDQ